MADNPAQSLAPQVTASILLETIAENLPVGERGEDRMVRLAVQAIATAAAKAHVSPSEIAAGIAGALRDYLTGHEDAIAADLIAFAATAPEGRA